MRSSADHVIDLNADVGEADNEEPLYALITSANIACGGHTGDDATMSRAIGAALRHGVAIGAHPGYPDREHFGRLTRRLERDELARSIAGQVAALVRVASGLGARVDHVKPHGALYNDAASRPEVANAVADAVASVAGSRVLVGLAGSTALAVWRQRGFAVAAEGFADRRYGEGGTLVSRAEACALITDPDEAAAQALRLARGGVCTTLCVHGDTPGAAAIALAVRGALEESGFVVASLRRRGSADLA